MLLEWGESQKCDTVIQRTQEACTKWGRVSVIFQHPNDVIVTTKFSLVLLIPHLNLKSKSHIWWSQYLNYPGRWCDEWCGLGRHAILMRSGSQPVVWPVWERCDKYGSGLGNIRMHLCRLCSHSLTQALFMSMTAIYETKVKDMVDLNET
jgi:hypothetical protein